MRDLSQYDNLRTLIKTGDLVEWCGKGFVELRHTVRDAQGGVP